MSEIIWKQIYSIGIKEIDDQHKKLFELLSKIGDFSTVKELQMSSLVDEIRDYTNYHFDTEENLMKKYDYPNINEHIEEHTKFINRIEKIVKDSNNSLFIYTSNLSDFIKSWIIYHVLGTDLELGQYLKMIGIE